MYQSDKLKLQTYLLGKTSNYNKKSPVMTKTLAPSHYALNSIAVKIRNLLSIEKN